MTPPQSPGGVGQVGNGTGRLELTIGVIHDVFGHTGAYVVRLLGGGTVLAASLQSVSGTPLGARQINHYQIGDEVVYASRPDAPYGIIVGAVPKQVYDPRLVLPVSLVQRSCMGFFYDQMHYAMYQNEKLGLANFSCGRPLDAVQGDWGYINELNVGVWFGKFLAQLRASELARVECFWGDDLVRIFSYNYQQYTAGRELFEFDDEGEYSSVETWTPFIWESLGAYKPGKAVFKDLRGDAGGINRSSEDSRYEPKDEVQSMVFRGMNLHGYLGDANKTLIVLPPSDGEEIATRDDDKKFRGVLEVHHGLDGAFHVRSAKEILLAKTLMMPVPRQLLDPDDPSGDTAVGLNAQYKPANQYGSGTDQEKKSYAWPTDIKAPYVRLVDLWDYQAYLFGKYGLQAIDAHKKDWKTPEEADVKIDTSTENEIDDKIIKTESGEGLKFQSYAPLPEYGEVTVDQRDENKARYYRARSCIHMLDDGSVTIEDGYGAQILLSGGHITMSCPGDVINRPGRNFITWAPRDFIARAGWCAEVSAAKADVRIKAEQNLHMLAGDGDKGCILLENRAVGKPAKPDWTGKYGEDIKTSGIIFKAPDSVIHCLTSRFYAGATQDDADAVVELCSGAGTTILSGSEVGVEALGKFGVLIGSSIRDNASPSCAPQLLLQQSRCSILATVDINGDLGVWAECAGGGNITQDGEHKLAGSVRSDGSISCVGTMTANGGMITDKEHNSVGERPGPNVQTQGPTIRATTEATYASIFGQFADQTIHEQTAGAAVFKVWEAIGFSFRLSKEHYKTTENYKVFETRSQQLYRAFGVGKKWDEPIVNAPDGTPTRPHPGQDAWTDGEAYNYATPSSAKNVDFTKGTSKSRDGQSEEGLAIEKATLESEYIVTVQKPT